ncbi:NADH-quinone oxidoreductase subunit N [Kibdelosporangium phytohabitans]|uniref:NADH-quinone oxidoreductase subunit N n=1 Tax=Kibdelosporangium phytohabitans TaxID=860235 RepID=A0A0N9I6A5_9PSEU|nr:NADH-quinone oxidoreductase subunit N [Kibdelosporangium phytohabitans]ALG11211.1 NADH-quinone oxidoreductase subunit N [Kibdelosporangium phytohabitans]MBE1462479.1 NADH-quinone oxidoreductase subunit N [Kibdelosporangium phytohabitans]
MVQSVDYLAIAPPLILALTGLVSLFLPRFVPFAGILVAGVFEVALVTGSPRRTFCVDSSCSFVVDDFTLLMQTVVLIAGAVVLLMAHSEIRETRLPAGEFHFLTFAALTGAMTLVAGRDLVTLLVALEVVSLPLFALVALRRYDGRSSEAGVKMFLVSVVSTAVMLFGISLVYGAAGTLFLDRIGAALGTPSPVEPVAAVGVVLVLVGLGFKVSAVPFHFWAPDTYQGAPVAVAALLSVISKAAGFAGLVLVLSIGFVPYANVWGPLIAVLAAVSMTVGNLVALRQRTAIRLLAWSSIAQAGYMLAPLGAAGAGAPLDSLVAATIGYVAIYSVMNIGVFAVITVVGWVSGYGGGALEDYRGLARTHPLVAIALAFFLACLAGLPPGLAGLFAKIVVFQGAIAGGLGWLAVVMAVNTVIGLFYYLTWATRLFAPLPDGARFGGIARPVAAAISVAAVGTVLMSVMPQLVLGITTGG